MRLHLGCEFSPSRDDLCMKASGSPQNSFPLADQGYHTHQLNGLGTGREQYSCGLSSGGHLKFPPTWASSAQDGCMRGAGNREVATRAAGPKTWPGWSLSRQGFTVVVFL